MTNERHYWLHRVSHEGGLDILKNKSILTIGFSAVAASKDAVDAMGEGKYKEFCKAYTDVYKGDIERIKNNLWRFVVEMKKGDFVVVPCPWGFYVCEITGEAMICAREGLDLGWERRVNIIGDVCSPREKYARAALLSRMKCRQTTLSIDDLKDDVDCAREGKAFDLVADTAEVLHAKLKEYGRPEDMEQYVAWIFRSMGADVTVLPKHFSGKTGDCDVEAVFPMLRLVVSVQCKKHDGVTDDWGVTQIASYANEKCKALQDGWSCWQWVVSTADEFSSEAISKSKALNIRLVNGKEFCRMLASVGIR